MPFIPLPTNAPQADIAAPVLNRERAPTIDTRGIQQGLGQLAQASQSDMIPVEPFLAPGQGGKAIGQGMQSLGGVFAKLAEAKAEARNDLDAANGMNALDMTYADFEERKQKLPPDRWEAEWAERSGKAIGDVMANDRLAPEVRRRLELNGKRWQGQSAVRVARDATMEMGQRAENAAFAGIDRSIESGDIVGARAKAAELTGAGKAYVNPLRLQQVDKAIKAKEKELVFNDEFRLIHKDPDAYLAEHGEIRPDESPEEYSTRINEANQSATQQYHDKVNAATDAMVLAVESAPASKAKAVAAFEESLQFLKPTQQAKVKDTYKQMLDENQRTVLAEPETLKRNMGLLDDMVADFDRNAPDARDRLLEIKSLTNLMLPAGYRDYIINPLDRKWFAKPPPPDAAIVDAVKDAIEGQYKEGGFGPVTRPVKQGYNIVSQEWEKAEPGVTYSRERMGKEAVPEALLAGPRAAKAQLLLNIMPVIKAHKEWANDPDGMKKAFEVLNSAKNWSRNRASPSLSFTAPATPPPLEPAPPPAADTKKKKKAPEPTGPAINYDADMPDDSSGGGASAGTSLLPAPGEEPPPSGAVWVADKNVTAEVMPMTKADIETAKASGQKNVKVWDAQKGMFVLVPPDDLVAGRHMMPAEKTK